jgi:hypothetical protein
VLAGTHKIAHRAAGKCAEIAYCAVLGAPEGYTQSNKRCHWDKMRGQTGIANIGGVFRHRWSRRSAFTLPNFWASLG